MFKNKQPQSPINYKRLWCNNKVDEHLFDCIIHLDNLKKMKIHKIVLTASSDYFRALFTYNTEKNIFVANLPERVFQLIINYSYTGLCDVNWCNINEILPAADYYSILGLLRQCYNFLIENITIENCIEIYNYAKFYHCYDVVEKAHHFILINFKELFNRRNTPKSGKVTSTQLQKLSPDDLYKLLLDEKLNLLEEYVFEVIRNWIEIDYETNSRYLPKLLTCIRFGLMDIKFFHECVLTWPPINRNPVT